MMLAVLTTLCACFRLFGLVAFALVLTPLPALAQEAHGAIAFGQTAYGDSIAYGFAWNYSTKGEAIDAAVNACRAGGGTNCEELAWFQNGCGALAVDRHGGPQGKSAMSQDQAEARAMKSCEAAGATGCAVVASQCAAPGGQAGTWSGSERVLVSSETDTGKQGTDLRTQATEVREEALTREQRIHVQRGLASLGFEGGPADGVFGPKTRAGLRNWQDAKGLAATGYLSMTAAEALAAVGMEAASAKMDTAAGKPAVSAAVAQERTFETTVQWITNHINRKACRTDRSNRWRYSANASGGNLVLTVVSDHVRKDAYCHRNCIKEDKYEADLRNVKHSRYYDRYVHVTIRVDTKQTNVRSYRSDFVPRTYYNDYFDVYFCGASARANAAELHRAIQRLVGLTGGTK